MEELLKVLSIFNIYALLIIVGSVALLIAFIFLCINISKTRKEAEKQTDLLTDLLVQINPLYNPDMKDDDIETEDENNITQKFY